MMEKDTNRKNLCVTCKYKSKKLGKYFSKYYYWLTLFKQEDLRFSTGLNPYHGELEACDDEE